MSLERVGVCYALLVSLPSLLSAQVIETGFIAGRVTARSDTVAALPAGGAVVSVLGTAIAASTTSGGRFLLEHVPVGTRTVRVRLLGYATADREIRVRGGDTTVADFLLDPSAQLLAPIRTDAPRVDAERFASTPGIATVVMSAATMAGVPNIGEPDVVRVVQLLPGVVQRNDFNTGLNVRGGEADQNLVLLDGHPIYNPFHLGGLSSTFMDATVGGIELLTGAFPARYGGRLSSVLDVSSAQVTRAGVHGSADLSALGATGRIAGSMAEGKGTWSVAARRTYADAVTTIFTSNIFPYHFYDFHGRATYALPGGVQLGVTAYAGRDVLDANLAEFDSDSLPSRASQGRWAFNWGNRVVGATLSKQAGTRLTLEQRVSTSGFSTLLDLGEGASSQRNSIRDIRLAGSALFRGSAHDASVGYDVATHRVRYASSSSQTGTTDVDFVQTPTSAAGWLNDLWRVSPRLLVEGGVRGELLTGRDWAALSPRLAVKFFATPEFALKAATGRATQWQHSLAGDGPLRYFEIWIASDSFIPVAAATHFVAGAERRLGDAGSIGIEGYVKRYDRVMEANWSEDPHRRGDEFFTAEGKSYGVDMLARWHRGTGVGGWISYSYGVSSRSRDGIRWAPGHDRRHDLDLVATWRLSKYLLGGRFGFATGTPYTPIVGAIARRVYDPSRDRWGTGDPRIFVESLGGALNGARFPPAHRLDLDVSRTFQYRGSTLTPYISVVNAYNAKNVFVYVYNYSTDAPTRRAISQFPILPSAGVRIVF